MYDILFVSSRSVSDAARCLRGLKRARFIVEDRIKGGTRIFCVQNFWLSFRTNQMYLIDPVRFESEPIDSERIERDRKGMIFSVDYAMCLRIVCVRVVQSECTESTSNRTKFLFWNKPVPVIPWMAYSRKRFFRFACTSEREWAAMKSKEKKKREKSGKGNACNWITRRENGHFENLSFTHFDIYYIYISVSKWRR